MRLSPTPETPGARAPWLGLRLPFEMLTAPRRAFADIVARPEWLSAYAVLLVSGLVYLSLIAPASIHLETVLPPPDGFSGKTALDLKSEIGLFLTNEAFAQAISPLFAMALTATVLGAVARFKGVALPFTAYFSLAANCLVPTALGSLLSGTITALHPAASYHDYRALVTAVPLNLAVFADPARTNEALFLGGFDLFALWSAVLLAYGFAAMVPVKFGTALGISFGLTFAFAVIPALIPTFA
ncbi:MAG: YIP1 family protein [Candidatus Eremiobacteraeota bacterium]|nr:YIP1 family protein [Candidatus Eremiobacteraeota bacterium]